MSNYRIVENSNKKSITVIFGGTRFFSAKYLLELYGDGDKGRYFGNANVTLDKEELRELLRSIARALNNQKPEVKVTPGMFFESDNVDFPLVKRRLNQEDEWDGSTYEIALSVFAKGKERNLFFEDLARTKPVTNEDVIKSHEWAIELEIVSNLDEETLEPKLFIILHRIIKGKQAGNYSANDDAWKGFNMGVEEEEEVKDEFSEDDLGF